MKNTEETIYNGVLSYRNNPDDKPTMYTRQELTEIILSEREERESEIVDNVFPEVGDK